VSAGRRRHSATELLVFARCPRRHWLKYVAGLREPEVERAGPQFISAIARGQIVHDVLEKLREDTDLDRLLEDAIGRWDREAPPPEGAPGERYRRHLKEEVELVAKHPAYRAIADLPTARRELGFVHLRPGGSLTQGAVDLAALRLDGLALVDVKTSQMPAADARRRAGDYAPQRDVYVAAAEGISGLSVAEFALQFSRAGVQVPEPVTPATRQAIETGLAGALGAIEAGERSLTGHPRECQWCGYKKAGWCPGVAPEPKEA
jgi:CRISPR/Cas system-associated exonuclease Cas4 (RecB family)